MAVRLMNTNELKLIFLEILNLAIKVEGYLVKNNCIDKEKSH